MYFCSLTFGNVGGEGGVEGILASCISEGNSVGLFTRVSRASRALR
jgi:hypothetical protein